ncbi:MAG TPA: AI-2E family transporter [Sphingobium sp.]|uniref:AI-2E family transporter n=1 Tax=Sphingobium sp. TaxID=1912891 RepID=UPI002ED505CB
MESDTLGIFTRKSLIILILVALAAIALKLVYLLTLVFAAIVLAVMLRAIARHLIWLRLPDGLAVAVSVIALVGGVAGFIWMFGGLVAGQFDELRTQLPTAADVAQKQLNQWGIHYDIDSLTKNLGGQVENLFSRASGFVIAAGGVIADIVVVLAGGIFFAAQPDFYRAGALRLVPKAGEPLAARILDDSGLGLKQWLAGQLLSSFCVVVLMTGGLLLLDVPSALALAIIAGVMDFVPFIGPVIAAIPAVLLGFSKGPTTALWTLILFLIVQQIQGNVLQPMVQKKSVDLPPVILLFAVIAMGVLFGPPGILLAAPLTVVGYILVQHLYIGHVLGREPKRPGRQGQEQQGQEA